MKNVPIISIPQLSADGRNDRICGCFIQKKNFEFFENSNFSAESVKQTRKPGALASQKTEFQIRETPFWLIVLAIVHSIPLYFPLRTNAPTD
jgi:hypothetical protein